MIPFVHFPFFQARLSLLRIFWSLWTLGILVRISALFFQCIVYYLCIPIERFCTSLHTAYVLPPSFSGILHRFMSIVVHTQH